MKDLRSIQKAYSRAKLNRKSIDEDPIIQFNTWMDEVIASKLKEPTAMVLSTVSAKGVPSSRVVLLKGIELGKFVFYTNYNSDKSLEIMENANVALTFYWADLERQVNIRGSCQKVAVEISEEYFQTRSRKSQLGAWASQQSKELSSRLEMVKEFLALGIKYMGKKVPRPSHWGGYEITPESIEFWQGRPHRLHDRITYTKEIDGKWKIIRLYP